MADIVKIDENCSRNVFGLNWIFSGWSEVHSNVFQLIWDTVTIFVVNFVSLEFTSVG